jgi:hypothetical protein
VLSAGPISLCERTSGGRTAGALSFFLFVPFFLLHARKTIFVRTFGASDFDAAFQLQLDGPVHPRDAVADWRDRDRMGRDGLAPMN